MHAKSLLKMAWKQNWLLLRRHLQKELGNNLDVEKRYNELSFLIEFISYVRKQSINFMHVAHIYFEYLLWNFKAQIIRQRCTDEFDKCKNEAKLPPFVLHCTTKYWTECKGNCWCDATDDTTFFLKLKVTISSNEQVPFLFNRNTIRTKFHTHEIWNCHFDDNYQT